MQAALGAEPALARTRPRSTCSTRDSPETGRSRTAGAPHVLVVRTPDGGLTWLRALGSRQRRRDHRDPGVLHRVPDQRRVLRLPAAAAAAGRGAAMLPARHPPLPARSPSWAQAACSPGPATSSRSSARRTRPSTRRWPGATRRWTRSCWRSCASATTRPSPSGSRTTGTGTGTTATTPATRSAAGCATTQIRSGCSPASSPSTGRTIWLHTAPPGGVAQYSSGVGWLGWLADVILAWGGDIFAGSRAAGDAVGVAAA